MSSWRWGSNQTGATPNPVEPGLESRHAPIQLVMTGGDALGARSSAETPVSLTTSGGTHYYQSDQLGSVSNLTSSTGAGGPLMRATSSSAA